VGLNALARTDTPRSALGTHQPLVARAGRAEADRMLSAPDGALTSPAGQYGRTGR